MDHSVFENKQYFCDIVEQSKSIKEIINKLNINVRGGTYYYNKVKKYCNIYGIKIPYGTSNVKKPLSLEQIFIQHSKVSLSSVKKYAKQIINYKCALCGLDNIWNGKNITLQLDHINGINNDNRIENIRFLCPNCHSQTITFSIGQRKLKQKNKCIDCNALTSGYSPYQLRCIKCNAKFIGTTTDIKRRKVINRPSKEELENMLWKIPTSAIAQKYDVSDKAVEKWAKKYNLTKPPRGYWSKISAK